MSNRPPPQDSGEFPNILGRSYFPQRRLGQQIAFGVAFPHAQPQPTLLDTIEQQLRGPVLRQTRRHAQLLDLGLRGVRIHAYDALQDFAVQFGALLRQEITVAEGNRNGVAGSDAILERHEPQIFQQAGRIAQLFEQPRDVYAGLNIGRAAILLGVVALADVMEQDDGRARAARLRKYCRKRRVSDASCSSPV